MLLPLTPSCEPLLLNVISSCYTHSKLFLVYSVGHSLGEKTFIDNRLVGTHRMKCLGVKLNCCQLNRIVQACNPTTYIATNSLVKCKYFELQDPLVSRVLSVTYVHILFQEKPLFFIPVIPD